MRLGRARARAPLAMLAIVAIVFGACGTAATTPPSAAAPTTAPTTAPTSAAPSAAATTAAPTAAATSGSPFGCRVLGRTHRCGLVSRPGFVSPASSAAGEMVLTAAWAGPCCNGVDAVDGVFSGGGDAHWYNKIYGRLTTWSVSSENQYDKLIGDLADTWEVSSDKLTWTFHLHPGITWHDGEKFTANDVKFTFDLCLNPKSTLNPCQYGAPLYTLVGAKEVQAGTATEISGVKVVDDNTIALTFTTPNALFPINISELFILPQHALKDIPVDQLKTSDYWKTKQIGTGPFKWDKYVPGQEIELVAFDNYWRGRPKIDRIIRREYQDLAAGLLAFDNGELDFIYITADEVAREEQNANATVIGAVSGVDNAIVLNQDQASGVREPQGAPGDGIRDRPPERSSTRSMAATPSCRPACTSTARPSRVASSRCHTILPRPRRSSLRPAWMSTSSVRSTSPRTTRISCPAT